MDWLCRTPSIGTPCRMHGPSFCPSTCLLRKLMSVPIGLVITFQPLFAVAAPFTE